MESDVLELNRVDLADVSGRPDAMARAVHRQIGRLAAAVPIEHVAGALDIAEIRKEELDGCEGVLLSDRLRNYGRILVNTRGGPSRIRCSIAHELGHFLLENHILSAGNGFVCDRADMRDGRAKTRHQRKEREANRFAIEMLAPAYLMRASLAAEPGFGAARRMGSELEICLEAAIRRFVELHDKALTAVMTKDFVVHYCARNGRFPWIKLKPHDRIAPFTQAHRIISAGRPGVTRFASTHSSAWTEAHNLEITEQTRLGQDGYAVTLLRAEPDESEPEDDDAGAGVEKLDMPRFR